MSSHGERILAAIARLGRQLAGVNVKVIEIKNKSTQVDTPTQYTINAVHEDGQSKEKQDGSIRATLHLPESIRVQTKSEEDEKKWFKDRKHLLQCAGVAAAVIYAFIAYEQWQDTRIAFRVDERAWVALEYPIKLIDADRIEAGIPFKFKIRFKNTGKTPALAISYDPVIIVQDIKKFYPDYDTSHGKVNGMEEVGIHESALLSPGEEAYITFPAQAENAQKWAFDEPSVRAIDEMRQALFMVGKVTYQDVFFPVTPEHHTKFCLIYSPKVGELSPCPLNRGMD